MKKSFRKKQFPKKRLTFHDMALRQISGHVGGVDSHHEMIRLNVLIPDIITEDTVHEVQAIDIRWKMAQYLVDPSIFKRVLWLALPVGASRIFNEIKLVEINDKGFEELPVLREKLKPLLLPTPPFTLMQDRKNEKTPLDILREVEMKLKAANFDKEAEVFKFVREKLWSTYLK